MMTRLFVLFLGFLALAFPASAQQGPLRIEITEGVIEPLPFAAPAFVAQNAEARDVGEDIANVVASDLASTGLFREIQETSLFLASQASPRL